MPLSVGLVGINTSGSRRKGQLNDQTQGGRNKYDVISGDEGPST